MKGPAFAQIEWACTQSVLQQLMESGTVSKLPEDLQWSIRLLMPRMPGTAAAPVAGVTPVAQAATVAAGPVQAVPALAAAAPSAAQPGGLGFGNLVILRCSGLAALAPACGAVESRCLL